MYAYTTEQIKRTKKRTKSGDTADTALIWPYSLRAQSNDSNKTIGLKIPHVIKNKSVYSKNNKKSESEKRDKFRLIRSVRKVERKRTDMLF